jgi:hypothetical protein
MCACRGGRDCVHYNQCGSKHQIPILVKYNFRQWVSTSWRGHKQLLGARLLLYSDELSLITSTTLHTAVKPLTSLRWQRKVSVLPGEHLQTVLWQAFASHQFGSVPWYLAATRQCCVTH